MMGCVGWKTENWACSSCFYQLPLHLELVISYKHEKRLWIWKGQSVVSASESLFIWFVESASSALSCFWRKRLSSRLTGLPLHLQKYVEQLLEHRYIVLCGEQGLGKSYLATKLAEHVVQRWERNTKRHWVFVSRRLSRHSQDCKWLYSLQSWKVCL